MELNVHESCKGAVNKVMERLRANPIADKALADCVLNIGPSTDSRFGVSPEALFRPAYVGDSAHIGAKKSTAEIDALSQTDAKAVGMSFQWNGVTKKYDVVFSKTPYAADGYAADAVDLIAAQTITPWSVNWFSQIFKQPLAWSKARNFVQVENGNDPWAEVMSLPLATFSGFAALNNAGSVSNSRTQDVEIQTGMMSRMIINMDVTYKITVEELNRLQSSSAPWAGQMISQKQEYANWVLEMLTDVLIYWGNAATGTDGLFTVVSPTAWSGVGSSMSVIAAGASASKGSDMYAMLAGAVADFLTTNLNKLTEVDIGMSPLAYNILSKQAYSAVYNPKSPLAIFMENFAAGETKDGSKPTINIFPDALLSASTVFNALATDYMVITSPRIGGGPNDEPQPIIRFGAPLMDFVYPVIPGQYHTQYKQLRRAAGIFAPYTPAIKVYTGFGV
jgi:hypothetical protein